jgi:hypothetical protein
MTEIELCDLKNLAAAVLEHAAREAKKGDPLVAAWFLSDDAMIWAGAADLEPETMGRIANRFLEVLVDGS